jgi:hypothetical protein
MRSRNELLEELTGVVFEDDFGRSLARVSVITEESIALLQHRVLLCQTDDEAIDDGQYVEFAIKSDNTNPIVFLSLSITAQMESVKLELFEGGTAADGAMPTCIQPNRIPPIPTPNSSVIKGTPSTPITGTLGTPLTGPSGWKIIGLNGVSSADLISTTIDIGGFLCMPSTWYRLRLTNTSSANDRTIQLSLKYVDAND